MQNFQKIIVNRYYRFSAGVVVFALLCSLYFTPALAETYAEQYPDDNPPDCTPSGKLERAPATVDVLPKAHVAAEMKPDKLVTDLAWSPDGRYLATSDVDVDIITVWDTETFKPIWSIDTGNRACGSQRKVLFTSDGRNLITPYCEPTDPENAARLRIYEAATGNLVRTVEGPVGEGKYVTSNFMLSPDGRMMYVTFLDRVDHPVSVFDTSNWSYLGYFPSTTQLMQVGPQSDQITFFDNEGAFRIFNTSEEKYTNIFHVNRNLNDVIDYAPAFCMLAIGSPNGNPMLIDNPRFTVWDLSKKQRMQPISRIKVNDLHFSPHDKRILAVASGKQIMLFRAPDFDRPKVIYEFDNFTTQLAFSPDGNRIAAAGYGKVVIINLK